MKIGMVSKFGDKDGIAIYSDSLVAALRKKGIQVITIGDKNSVADYKINLKSFFLKSLIERIARKEKLQLIHIQYIAERSYYGLHTLNFNLLKALQQKVPVVATLHEVHFKAWTLQEKIVKKLEETVIRNTKAVIIHTKGQQSFIAKKYKRKTEVIPMGVTLHQMHRKKGKNILFFGMISEAKGVEYLVEAMRSLPGYRLVIAGRIVSKPYAEKLAVMIERQGNKSIKADFGWVSDGKMHEYFENSDILVLPYIKAPYQSAVLHDAMSYGLPVVVTRVGTIWDIVDEYNCGEVVPPGKALAIAEGIRNAEKNYRKHQKGIEKYRKEANWASVAGKTIKVYEKALKQR